MIGTRLLERQPLKVLNVALSYLSATDRKKLFFISGIQFSIAFLDLIGIFLVGIVASVTLFGIQSKELPSGIKLVLETMNIQDFSFQSQVAILGLLAGALLVSKTMFSAFFSRRILFFLGTKTSDITVKIFSQLLELPHDFVKSKSPATVLFSVTRGVESIVSGVIGSASLIMSELGLLIVVTIGVMIFDPVITIFCIIYFGTIGWLQARTLNNLAFEAKSESVQWQIKADEMILNSLALYREFHVRSFKSFLISNLIDARSRFANLRAQVLFMPYIAKYLMEVSLVIGAIALTASQFIFKDSVGAFTTLSIFLVAASRVSPSILRLQQGLIQFRAFSGESTETISMVEELERAFQKRNSTTLPQIGDTTGVHQGTIVCRNVSFRYWDSSADIIKNFSLNVSTGSLVALVGPSGNGKSTIMDLMLGILLPRSGVIEIEGLPPIEFLERYPGKIGYVPQESIFLGSTLRDNLLLGLNPSEVSDMTLNDLLSKVGLLDTKQSPANGLDAFIGERGSMLSVGQRQRLSLARALVTEPRILFLDEPTSSLDSESERLVTNLLAELKGRVTIVVIAHRLETIKNADLVVYVEDGRVKKSGTFNQVYS